VPYLNDRAPASRLRLGLDVAEADGVNNERDPSAIKPSEFVDLKNVDFKGNRLVNRDGLAKFNSGSVMTGSVTGIADDRAMGIGGGQAAGIGTRVYIVRASETVTQSIITYDFALTTPSELLTMGYFPNTLFFDSGYVWCGLETGDAGTPPSYLARFRPGVVSSPSGAIGDSQASPEPVALLSATQSYVIRDFVKLNGDLFFSVMEETSAAAVYKWDGQSLTRENSYAGNDAFVAVYRESVVVMYNENPATTPVVRSRSAAGTYSAISFPVSPATFTPTAARQYKDKLFISGFLASSPATGYILQLDGTSLTLVKTISNSRLGVGGLEVYGGYLYYSYTDTTTSPDTVYLGRYDNSSFSDAYATVTTGNTNDGGLMTIQGNRLYMLCTGSKLAYAPTSDLTSWSTVTLASTDIAGVRQGPSATPACMVAV
jgi:hypothetical protein